MDKTTEAILRAYGALMTAQEALLHAHPMDEHDEGTAYCYCETAIAYRDVERAIKEMNLAFPTGISGNRKGGSR